MRECHIMCRLVYIVKKKVRELLILRAFFHLYTSSCIMKIFAGSTVMHWAKKRAVLSTRLLVCFIKFGALDRRLPKLVSPPPQDPEKKPSLHNNSNSRPIRIFLQLIAYPGTGAAVIGRTYVLNIRAGPAFRTHGHRKLVAV